METSHPMLDGSGLLYVRGDVPKAYPGVICSPGLLGLSSSPPSQGVSVSFGENLRVLVTTIILKHFRLYVNILFLRVAYGLAQQMAQKKRTLGDFILSQMDSRGMSAREFAKLVEVDGSIISKFLNHGIEEMYAGKPVGDPSLDFLYKLAKATGTDIRYLVGILYPDAAFEDAHAAMLTQMITKLSRANRETLETFLLGLLEREKLTSETP